VDDRLAPTDAELVRIDRGETDTAYAPYFVSRPRLPS